MNLRGFYLSLGSIRGIPLGRVCGGDAFTFAVCKAGEYFYSKIDVRASIIGEGVIESFKLRKLLLTESLRFAIYTFAVIVKQKIYERPIPY
jgi:hypothetical protein